MRELKGRFEEEIVFFIYVMFYCWDIVYVGSNEGFLLVWGFFNRIGNYFGFGVNEDVIFEGFRYDSNVFRFVYIIKENGEDYYFLFYGRI